VLQQADAGCLADIDDAVEAIAFAIVGVWDFGISGCFRIEISQKLDLRGGLGIRRDALEVGSIRAVHGNQEIEALEVIYDDLPRASVDIETTALAGSTRSRVRTLSDVPSTRASAVDLDKLAQMFALEQHSHCSFSGRGAADVA